MQLADAFIHTVAFQGMRFIGMCENQIHNPGVAASCLFQLSFRNIMLVEQPWCLPMP